MTVTKDYVLRDPCRLHLIPPRGSAAAVQRTIVAFTGPPCIPSSIIAYGDPDLEAKCGARSQLTRPSESTFAFASRLDFVSTSRRDVGLLVVSSCRDVRALLFLRCRVHAASPSNLQVPFVGVFLAFLKPPALVQRQIASKCNFWLHCI